MIKIIGSYTSNGSLMRIHLPIFRQLSEERHGNMCKMIISSFSFSHELLGNREV